MGKEIQLTTTRNDYLQINAVEPFGWSTSGAKSSTKEVSGGSSSTSTSYNIPANTKVGFD